MSDSASDAPSEDAHEPFHPSSQPHDAYFKQVFSDPATAAGFFRNHLPAEIAMELRWDQLSVVPGSFIKRSLQQAHSDLLFSVPAGDQEILLYLLFEHQTSVDRAMPLRLLVYMSEIWQAHERRAGLPLPPVIPFVLHQGPEKWEASFEFLDLIRVPEALASSLVQYLPVFRHGLLDLTRFEPADQEADHTLRVVLQLMKLARERDRLLEFWGWLAGQTIAMSESLLLLSLLYALHADGNLDVEQIFDRLHSNPELQRATMSTAEKLIAQGRVQGHAQGREEGLERGVWMGKIHVLEQMLNRPLSSKVGMEGETLKELERRFEVLQLEYGNRFKNK